MEGIASTGVAMGSPDRLVQGLAEHQRSVAAPQLSMVRPREANRRRSMRRLTPQGLRGKDFQPSMESTAE